MKNIVLSQEQLQEMAQRLGKEITEALKDEKKIPVIVGVMKGSLNFMMDLLKNIDRQVYTDYIQISSYSGTSTTGRIRLVKDLGYDCQDRTVVIVEDIIDSGYSMSYLIEHIQTHKPKKIYVCSMLDKKNARKVPVKVDFVGQELVKNDFLIGYGLDYNELGRNLPYIYSATPEDVKELDDILAKDK
ncbi:MAG: hypoxanthine phosphoribosyltransferase [Bacilli bacterium]|nr:hypoxanthine phosphoribosyltransferase [Bacilli bacterium]